MIAVFTVPIDNWLVRKNEVYTVRNIFSEVGDPVRDAQCKSAFACCCIIRNVQFVIAPVNDTLSHVQRVFSVVTLPLPKWSCTNRKKHSHAFSPLFSPTYVIKPQATI